MRAVALADFGSTFTKVAIVESGTGGLLARAQAPTTVGSDVINGFHEALAEAVAQTRGKVRLDDTIAASSAGGGLRMAAVGLVPDLTAAAARQAALNAGAKVELVLSGALDATDAAQLADLRPEILLFSGGTDAGQERLVLENARALAQADLDCHLVVACNQAIAKEVAKILRPNGLNVDVVANVLPRIDRIDVEPARHAIHEAFVRHVIKGKALSQTDAFDRMVTMPTPEAVLRGTELLARCAGSRDLLVVDVGGATTDVHSFMAERPSTPWITSTGLPPLPISRSVQGDLGLRWSAPGVLAGDREWLETQTDGVDLDAACDTRRSRPEYVPDHDTDKALDRLLAASCVTFALRRHCGRLVTVYRAGQGVQLLQQGADLRDARLLVGTGGILVHDPQGAQTLAAALGRREEHSLTPRNPRVLLDRDYILAAAGLLASRHPHAAAALLETNVLGGSDAHPTALQPDLVG